MKKMFLLISIVVLLCSCGGNASTISDSTTGEGGNESQVHSETNQTSSWDYSESIDEMTDKMTYFATIESENSVDFDFPYEGGSTLYFTLRQSPQYGNDIYIQISKGQFNSGVNGTNIKMRFDDNEFFTVHCNQPSDYSQDLLFLQGYKKIVNQLKNSEKMKISVEFFNEGERTFSFKTADLQWNHLDSNNSETKL